MPRTNLKQSPIPVIPSTAQIVNSDGTVTRTGKLLLEQLQASDALQGTHAGRPDPSAAPDGALYVESDRLVLYSNINGAWHYVAGTMWGTINPDQRPTDLGLNDAGFDFRTVDDPAREFIWSQAYWVEVTPVRYGTHTQRLAVVTANVIDQMLWVETDRSDVVYQTQSGAWHYVAGTMLGTLSPDQRPTGLGANDAGFQYRATDQTAGFYWSGSAWVGTNPPSIDYQYVNGGGTLTLTTAATALPGLTLTLARAGLYTIRTVVDFQLQAPDAGGILIAEIAINGTPVSAPLSVFASQSITGSQTARSTVPGEWSYTAPAAGNVVTVLAYKSSGTGTSACFGTNSSLSATWIHA